jgi:tetratricopeptide (TPR) repeat protein
MKTKARHGMALLLAALASSTESRFAFCQEVSGAASSPSDEAAAEQRRTDAKAKYEQGADAYGAGRYKEAVVLFLAADKLSPSAPLSFNIARAEEKLGNAAGALRWYRDYLRRAPAAQNAALVQTEIATLARTLEKKGIQQLTVLSKPEGANVEIDDQPAVVAPWTGELRPGPHHFLFSRAGYADAQRVVELSATEPIDVSVQLEQESAVAATNTKQPASVNTSGAVPASEPATRGPRLGILPWVTLGVGGAALGGALTFEVLRRGAENDAKHASQIGYQAQLDREQSRQTAARIFLGVGGAFVVAGGVMLLFDTKPRSHVAGAGLVCLPRICAASALGRF